MSDHVTTQSPSVAETSAAVADAIRNSENMQLVPASNIAHLRALSNAIASSVATVTFDDDRMGILKATIMPGATDAEIDFFRLVCERTRLDPFAKQIHAVRRSTKRGNSWVDVWSYQTGIDGFRLIAERTGAYRGQLPMQWCGDDGAWRDVWLARTPPRAARAAVLRAGFDEPMIAVAHYDEYVQLVDEYEDGRRTGNKMPNAMWARMAAGQLAKCAEALALRKAFPQELSGLYTNDEMGQADNDAPRDDDRSGQRRAASERHRTSTQPPQNAPSASGSGAKQTTPTPQGENFTNGAAMVFPYGPLRERKVTLDALYTAGATRTKKGKAGAPDESIACGGEFVVSDARLQQAIEWIDGKLAKHRAYEQGDEQTPNAQRLEPDDLDRLAVWRDDIVDEVMRRAALLDAAAQSEADDSAFNAARAAAAAATAAPAAPAADDVADSAPAGESAASAATSPAKKPEALDDLPF